MENDLLGGLDQSVPVDAESILDYVEDIFNKSIEKKNPHIVIDACEKLIAISQLSGLALAKLFYLLDKNWHKYNQKESFEKVAVPRLGRHPHTIERYIRVWKLFAENLVPDELEDEMKQRNIKELIPIGNAVSEGYDFTEEDWEEIADAPDLSSVSRVVRDVKGEPPKTGSLQLVMDNIGTLWVYVDNKKYFIGSLEVNDDEEVVQKSINRIIKNSGIMKK
jgi:hypothetical protein